MKKCTTLGMFCLALFTARIASAQGAARATADSATLHGVVIARVTGFVLPFAIVSIPALNAERFANAQGQFVFPRLPVGKYTVHVRQLGYTAADMDVTLEANATVDLTVQLTRIAQKLEAMSVMSDWPCQSAGQPKTGGATTSVVFEQLEQNADRMRLLQAEFPFEVRAERWQILRASVGPDSMARLDTVVLASIQRDFYKPGKVVYSVSNARGQIDHLMQVPTLLDFADKTFQDNHCFLVRGIDNANGKAMIRIDFKPLDKIQSADVEGTVFLDSATYQLRSAEFRLTNVPKTLVGTVHHGFTTLYQELSPGLPVVGGIHAVTDLDKRYFHDNYFQSVEEQTPISVHFFGQRPDGMHN